MDNLYWIVNKEGKVVRFKRNQAQLHLWNNIWFRNVILKGRQLGFSTFIAIFMLDRCLFHSNQTCGIIDAKLDDAKTKLRKILFAYERLPAIIRRMNPLIKKNTEELLWANGSGIKVGTSHRGGTLQILHVSEYGEISARFPENAKEIKTGGFETVGQNSVICIESTAKGTGGEFYNTYRTAENLSARGLALTKLDFKPHFYPWHFNPEYRLNANVLVNANMERYFKGLEEAKKIVLDEQQKAWYVKKLESFSENIALMYQEHPSIPEEAFFVSLEGAYFRQQMVKMRAQGRIGTNLYDPSKPVSTFWDIGRTDATAIWFHQTDGVRHRLIHYYENHGEWVAHYAGVLRNLAKNEEDGGRGFKYGRHYGPHDVANQGWAFEGTVRNIAKDHGINFHVVPKIRVKGDSIEAARVMLGMTWIDEQYCERGIQVLDNYKKEWDDRLADWKKTPLHDWASHGADALQTGACGVRKHHVPSQADYIQRRRAVETSKSAWAV